MVTGSVPGFTFAIVDEAEFSAPTIQKQPMSGTTSRDEAASRILEAAEAEIQVFPVRDFGRLTSGCACACGYTSCAGGGTAGRME